MIFTFNQSQEIIFKIVKDNKIIIYDWLLV